jgi:trehalose synthase
MRERYLEANQNNAAVVDQRYDFVIVHDPQPAAIRSFMDGDHHIGTRWIWRCHIDLTQPLDTVWTFLSDLVGDYDACIFTMQDFVPGGFEPQKLALITPSIDPLSLKNIPLDHEIVHAVTTRYGVDEQRPLMLQVSRFDPWKDPLGVIDAFRIARERIDGLQLVMIASMASDDPEGWHYYSRTEEHRAGDPDISLLSNLQEVGALDVNAFQCAADVVVQKSLREGFGLTVTEGMWKRKAVVAGDVGGIRLQINDAVTGYLVNSVEGCAERVVQVMEDPERAAAMGVAARSIVRERYLTTRHLAEYLDLFRDLT